MLSADDVKKFIEQKRYDLDKEKRTLSAVQFTSLVSEETVGLIIIYPLFRCIVSFIN